jgi:hypothetical protein
MEKGDRVIIRDGSEAHGDHGTVFDMQNKLVLVEIDSSYAGGIEGTLWPVDIRDLQEEKPIIREDAE